MYEQLMEEVVKPENARAALAAVKRNKGAAGIDGMTIEQLGPHLSRHWDVVREKLLKGNWVPRTAGAARHGCRSPCRRWNASRS